MAAISGANIVTDGLVYYIDPSNSSSVSGIGTSIYNLTNSTVAGTFVGYTANPVDNTENESILIDNVSGYVNGPSNIALTNNFTVSVWFKVNVFNTGAIIGKWYAASGNAHRCWIMNTDIPTSSMAIVLSSDGTYTNPTIKRYLVPVNLNEYTHLAFTFASGTLLVYKNGTLATVTKSIDGSFSSVYDNATRSIQLGYFFDFQNYYNSANIGVVQIFNRVLSATEILQNYNSFESRYVTTDNIITSGLVYNIDASKNASYPGIGTTIFDLSGIGNTGTLTNGPTFSSQNSGSIVFDGTNDFINLPNTNLLTFGTNPFSVEFWMYSTYVYPGSGTIYKTILSNYNDYNSDFGSYFYLGLFNLNNSTLQNKVGVLDHTGNFLDFSFSVTVAPNQWTHITLTRNGSSFSWYKDGTLQISSSIASNNFSGVRTSKFGGGVSSVGTFTGSLPLLRIYNKTLSAQEVLQNYNATKNRYVNALPAISESLVLNLDAGNRTSYAGTGTTWYDLSGNNLNGTLINGPTYSGTGSSTYISFDGSNDYISIFPTGSTLSYNRSAFTVAGFTYMTSLPTSYYGVILSKWNTGAGNDNEFILNTTDGNLFQFAVDFDDSLTPDSQTNDYVLSTTTIVANTWYYVAATFNNGVMKMYVNGVLENTVTASVSTVKTNTNSSLDIGRFGTIYYSTGRRGLVQLYNRALSATEILQNFNFYRSRYGI